MKRRRRRPPSGPDHFEGETADDLARELGIDDLTMKSCVAALFDELLDLVEPGETPDEHYSVSQAGPARRDPRTEATETESEDEHAATT